MPRFNEFTETDKITVTVTTTGRRRQLNLDVESEWTIERVLAHAGITHSVESEIRLNGRLVDYREITTIVVEDGHTLFVITKLRGN